MVRKLLRFLRIAVLGAFVAAGAAAQTPVSTELPAAAPPSTASAEELARHADGLRARKDYAAAIEFYRAALKKSPSDSDIFNRVGIAQMQLGDYREARRQFESALKLNRSFAEAYNNLGVVFYLQRDLKKAIRNHQTALALDDTSASFHSNLGTALFSRKQFERAMREYERALQLDPAVFERTAATGVTARLASPQDRARYAYLLAKLYAKTGDYDRALNQLKKCREYGYSRIQDVYKDVEFSALRKDRRFAQVMGRATVAVPES
jgi:tetratricopeptide (TPR) repeat protein